MKDWIRDILFALFVGVAMPAMVLNFVTAVWREVPKQTQTQQEILQWVEQVPLSVKVRSGETVEEGDLDAYLVGVVLAEMPASFEPEALKAQAVVARTYARKAGITGGKHGDGSVCTEPSCCQGYLSEEMYLEQGGAQEAVERIRNAVYSTSGQVLTYDGQLIEATYFSCSGGSTEDAAAVWGRDFPYLQSVDSPGEEEATHYRDTVVFDPETVEEKLGIRLTGNPSQWVSAVSYTDGGGVAEISIGGKSFSGTELRSLLGLRSASFLVETAENAITITTRGYGHRVGMSQYGADAMAVAGRSYKDILTHYYQGAELAQISGEQGEP